MPGTAAETVGTRFCLPERKTMPGTAAGTVRDKASTVALPI